MLAGSNATTIARPVVNLSLALNYALGGTDVRGYHVVNAVVHLAAGLLCFGVVRRTLTEPKVPERLSRAATGLAFAIASIWTLHPLQTESVTYVCQRAESLTGLLLFATLWCSLRGARSPRPGAWSAAAVAACALGMATKEVMAAAPLVVLLHDRTFLAGSFGGALRARRGLYAGLAATWLLLAALVASSAGRAGSAGFDAGMSVGQYAATQPRAVVEYLRLAAWPDPLVLDRGARTAATAAEIVPFAAIVAVLVGATVWALVRRPALGFLGAWFFAILAPTSSFVPLATQTVAEHRMYLPLAGIVALGVVAAFELTSRLAAPDAARRAVLVAVLAALGWRTHVRNLEYAEPRTIWEQAVAHDPGNVRAQMNLGLVLARDGDLPGALARLDLAVAADPGNGFARILRGNLLHEAGRLDDAVADYTSAAASPQRAPAALTNRALVLAEQGRTDLALRDLDAAIARAPDHAAAFVARAAVRLGRREFDAAWDDVAAAERLGRAPSAAFLDRLRRESGRSE